MKLQNQIFMKKFEYEQFPHAHVCMFSKLELTVNSIFSLDQDNTSLIVSVAVPLVLFLLFCVLASFLYVRRKRGGHRATKESRANDNMSLPDSEVETSRKIYIKNFAEHFRLMSADSDFR